LLSQCGSGSESWSEVLVAKIKFLHENARVLKIGIRSKKTYVCRCKKKLFLITGNQV
jgi:hypothetical protein